MRYLTVISLTAYTLTIGSSCFELFDYRLFTMLPVMGCIVFRETLLYFEIVMVHCVVVMTWAKSEDHHVMALVPWAMYMVLMVTLCSKTTDSVRHSVDGKRLHLLYQYPLWFVAISITALCRVQMLWSDLVVQSFVVELVVFILSVLLAVNELDAYSSPLPYRSVHESPFTAFRSFAVMLFAVFWSMDMVPSVGHDVLSNIVQQTRYLALFKALMYGRHTMVVCDAMAGMVLYILGTLLKAARYTTKVVISRVFNI